MRCAASTSLVRFSAPSLRCRRRLPSGLEEAVIAQGSTRTACLESRQLRTRPVSDPRRRGPQRGTFPWERRGASMDTLPYVSGGARRADERLLERYADSRDPRLREQLTARYLPLAR